MKRQIPRFFKLRRLFLMGLAFKMILSGLLLMVWIELQTQKNALTPAQQAVFSTLQKNIIALQDELSLHKNHSPLLAVTDTSLSVLKLQALKDIQVILKQLAAGDKPNLSNIKHFLSENALQKLSSLRTANHISDASLQEELYHCFNDICSPKKQDSSLDNFIKIEESSVYAENSLIHTAFSQAQNTLSEANYDSALNALAQFPHTMQDTSCIQKIISILEERAAIKKLLISTQKDLLKDE